jgi:parallel beta-helix repeat protein
MSVSLVVFKMNRWLKKIALIACIAFIILPILISPVSADWVMFRGDLSRSGIIEAEWTPGQVTWNFSIGDKVRSSPAVSDGVVYVSSYDNCVYAVDGVTGAKLWSFKTGNDVYCSPVVADGVVYFASQDEKVYALNSSTGTQIWSRRFVNGYHTSTAAVVDGVVYLGGGDGYVYALNASDGSTFWSFRTNCNMFSCPAVSGGVVYVGSMDANTGNMYALDAATGVKLWNFSTGYMHQVSSSPAVVNGVVYFGSNDRQINALNAATGEKIWNYTTGAFTESSPAVVNGVVYIGANNNNLYALDANTGAKIWSFSAYNCIMSSPAVLDGVVYVGSNDNNVYAINASNGFQLWSYTTGGQVFSSPAVAKGGQVYIGSDDGHLYCINSKSVSPYYQLNIPNGPTSNGVKQYITIYPNGTISNPNAPITRDGNRYILTGDIGGSIRVQKDNIIIDGQGHSLFGNGPTKSGGDIDLNSRDHVTVMNTIFSGWFGHAISMGSMDIANPKNTVGSSNCIIINNTITGGRTGYCFSIWVEGTNNSISNNHIIGNDGMGVALQRGTQHTIANNLIENNGMYAISFEEGQATVRGNRMNNNSGGAYNFYDSNMGTMTPLQDIDNSNLVDGKPTYYWNKQHQRTVPSDAGYVLLINCSEITVSGLNIDKGGRFNSYSIILVDTTNSVVCDNIITAGNGIRIMNNRSNASNVSVLRNYLTTGMQSGINTTIASNTFVNKGIMPGSDAVIAYNNFTECDIAVNMQGYRNVVRNNNFQNNQVAIHIFGGGNNQIYHNNFLDNSKQVDEQHSDVTQWPLDTYYTSFNNTWNQPYPSGGNYWSDYTGNDLNKDGIGDKPYHIIENYTDQYPLIQTTNTIQPATENLLPTEKEQIQTSNPTEKPNPSATNNLPVSDEYNEINQTDSGQPAFWVLAMLTIVIVLAVLVIFHIYKTRKCPATTNKQCSITAEHNLNFIENAKALQLFLR